MRLVGAWVSVIRQRIGGRRLIVVAAIGLSALTVLSASVLAANLPVAGPSAEGTSPTPSPSLEFHSRHVELSPTPGDSLTPTAAATPSATTASAPATPRPTPTPFPFEAGVNVLIYGNDPAFDSKASAQLDHLASLHVNSVSLVFPIYTTSWTASTVYADPTWTLSSANIATFIKDAHQRHMRVMLRPLMDEASLHPAGKWRGQIAPASVSSWFSSYDNLMLGYARLAQAQHAEAIDIGTEFDSMQGYSSQWINLVSSLRNVYSGQLTYSANWAIWYPSFGWTLDFISVDAFFPLNAPVNATQAQLVAAWSPWIARVDGFSASFGKHVVFTELGTTSEVGSFQQPWLWSHSSGLSLEAQRLYYAASCQALKGRISGMYWWEYLLDPTATPTADPNYDPEGKPADIEIGRCYA